MRPKNQTYAFYQVKRVFLACPGDLVSERSRFPRVLETVNNVRAHSLGFHLEPIGWERVIPSFGRPQDLINKELEAADLVVVMFWNRIGSPSSDRSSRTGTLEEFDLVFRLHEQYSIPAVWVYFKKPTAKQDDQLAGVNSFRKQLEEGRQLFFREYDGLEQWEDMFREHLVAYLDALQRTDLDNFNFTQPDQSLLKGQFLGDGIYKFGTRMSFRIDLDGDGNDETITFWFSQFSYKLCVTKFGSGIYLPIPLDVERERGARIAQVAIKDVTNDGLPEILVAFGNGLSFLRVAIFGFNAAGRTSRQIAESSSVLIDQFDGQSVAVVHEGGTILMPYGSQGLASEVRWVGDHFDKRG